jgi:hypothetical protein
MFKQTAPAAHRGAEFLLQRLIAAVECFMRLTLGYLGAVFEGVE